MNRPEPGSSPESLKLAPPRRSRRRGPHPRRQARITAACTLIACLAVGALAAAREDDRSTAEILLREVDASPRKEAAGDLTARARAALERGKRMRSAGDDAHARLADSLARTWAEAARDVARATVVEESAAAARRGATDAGAIADREHALLEEAIAQGGRLRAQLDAMERDSKEPARASAPASTHAATRASTKPAIATDGGAPSTGKAVAGGDGAPATAKTVDGGAR